MDQVRLLVAVVLSFFVLFVWSYFFAPKPPIDQKQTQTSSADTKTTENTDLTKQPATQTPAATGSFSATPEVKAVKSKPYKVVVLENSLFRAEITENGGAIRSVITKNFKERVDETSPLKELVSANLKPGTLLIDFKGNSIPGIREARFNVATEATHRDATNSSQSFNLVWTSPEGLKITKTFTAFPNDYLIDYKVTIENNSDRALNDSFIASLSSELQEEKRTFAYTGPLGLVDKETHELDSDDIEDKKTINGPVKWAAYVTRYFMSAIVPTQPGEAIFTATKTDEIVDTLIEYPSISLQPGQQVEFPHKVYFGPLSLKVLSDISFDLVKAVNFGFFDIIARYALIFMNFIYSFIPNYGVAIILLTVCIKIVFWPLGTKSYKSMNEMKKLQPLIMELREKYKDDKKRMNEETMGLYKTYKVNPVSGCLPVLIQMPIFFALYRMLYQSIELRHAPFMGWITDLSAPDRLFNFDISIPFMEAPYGIPVMTLLMGASMLLQQKMSPPPGDPTQAKMMMMMPVIFTFIFINFSSGLVLYWFVNNLISIFQQYFTNVKLNNS